MSFVSVTGVVTGGRFAVPSAFVEIVENRTGAGVTVSVLNYAQRETVALSLLEGQTGIVGGVTGQSQGMTQLTVNGTALTVAAGAVAAAQSLWEDGRGSSLTVYAGTGTPSTGQAVELLAVSAGGQNFVVSARASGSGLTVHEVQANGSLVQVSTLADTAALNLSNVVSLATAEVGGQTFVIAGSSSEGGITVMRLTSAGRLEPVDSLGVAQMVPIPYVSAVDVAEIGGQTYVLVAAAGTSSLTVFRLTSTGELEPTDSLLDSRDTRFAGISQMDVFEVEGRVFVVVAGGDDGISVFELLPGGTLIHRQSIEDTTTLTLDNVSAIRAVVMEGGVQIVVASGADAGLTILEIDLSDLGGVVRGTGALTGTARRELIVIEGGATRVTAGGGDDVIADGTGRDTIFGGAGGDLFVLGADGQRDEIRDFNPSEDRLDLSCWPMLRSTAQLTITPTSTGAIITYGGETLQLYSSSGGSLTVAQVLAAVSPFPGGRYEVVPQAAPPPVTAPPPPAPTPPGSPPQAVVRGTDGNDLLTGSDQSETIFGGAGDDVLVIGAGRDSIYGGAGNDLVSYASLTVPIRIDLSNWAASSAEVANDTIAGVEGYAGTRLDDVFIGGGNGDWFLGNEGNDQIVGGGGNDRLFGGTGNDVLDGGDGADTIEGGDGSDFMLFGAGSDLGRGGAGHDAMSGGTGDDTLHGEGGNDTIAGSDGYDLIFGGSGNDSIGGGFGNDTLHGGEERDIIGGGLGNDLIYAGLGDDLASGGWGQDTLEGEGGNDKLAGSFDNDSVYGGAGNDSIGGGFGSDVIYGGTGNDMIGAGDGADLVYGGAGFDFLGGGNGNDTLDGGAWADTLNGGAGNDRLIGGAGSDVFVFSGFSRGEVDWIVDFTDGDDMIRMAGVPGNGARAKFDALDISSGVRNGVSGTVISYAGHVIFLEGVDSGDISQADFLFV